jgi:head-tail adaptor
MPVTISGKRRHHIRIYTQDPAATVNPDGQPIETPLLLGEAYAAIEPIGGMERVVASQTQADVLYRLKMPSTAITRGITPVCWILLDDDSRLNVTRAYDPDMRRREIYLDCTCRVTN